MSRIEMAMEKAARMREEGEKGETLPPAPAAAVQQAPRTAATAPAMPLRPLTPKNPFLVNLLNPYSPASEEYRKLKSALVKMTGGPEFRNSIMVSSAVPGEGKSLTALNLAISLAQGLDHTVLLVDADLRRPALHRYLEMEQGAGLAEILSGEAEIGSAIVPTGIGKLSVIPAGREVPNPVELFASQRMKGVVDELKQRYQDRYIIFDTPPLLPFAESRSLAHLVDGVVFVVMERLASQANVAEALEAIGGSRVLGMVYNAAAVDPVGEKYYYYRGVPQGAAP